MPITELSGTEYSKITNPISDHGSEYYINITKVSQTRDRSKTTTIISWYPKVLIRQNRTWQFQGFYDKRYPWRVVKIFGGARKSMYNTHRLFRHAGIKSSLLTAGSLTGYHVFSSSPPLEISAKNNNQIHPIERSSYDSSIWNSIVSNISRSLQPNITSLEDCVESNFNPSSSKDVSVLATSLKQRKTCLRSDTKDKNISRVAEYDFVIIGYGNTGQNALRTLREKCPHATIALIDPVRSLNPKGKKKRDDDHMNTRYFRDTVVEFDPSAKAFRLLADSKTAIGYRHGVLIATGARGAPPPLELFQEASLARVLELRPTELSKNTKRPMMAPEKVRKAVAEAASRGAKIAILGSGWEALDLLLVAERATKSTKKRPTLSYANPGIAWNILPSYLSSELRKKLSKRDIDLQDRSFVRYVADYPHSKRQQIELHNAKTYDLLDTRRTILDLLVVAPDSFGDKGTAALPTQDIPERMKESSDGRPWYKTWSQMAKTPHGTEPSTVVCFEDDGRIAVNTELSVASRIYAAGSCAKYPNSSTGHSCIAGEGSIDGPEAGRVAALNMSREYRQAQDEAGHSFVLSGPLSLGEACSFATNSLPVWRSDITSYPAVNGDRLSALPNIGINALCEYSQFWHAMLEASVYFAFDCVVLLTTVLS